MSLLSLSKKRRNRESLREEPASKRGNVPSGSNTNLLQMSNWQCSEEERRCGKIISIHLINFMCHSNLLIEFDPRINFVVGNNGSGKSAILAALVLGFGCNAKLTSRSRSAKDFIKVNQTSAKIEITISNNGLAPFEHDVYGDYIKIERIISTTSGYYRIKNARGSIISKKYDDLQRILLYHNIQVDNPVFVLNQDYAREFLKDLEPHKNYDLFLKATQIDLITEKLNECRRLHFAHCEEINNAKDKLARLDEEIAEIKSKLEKTISFNNLKNTLKHLEQQYAWLQVKQHEDNLDELCKKYSQYQLEKNELENLISNRESFHTQINLQIQEKDTLITNQNKEYSSVSMQLREIKSQYNEYSILCSECQNNQDALNRKKSRLENQIVELEQHIEQRLLQSESSLQQFNKSKLMEYRKICDDDLEPIINSLKHDLDNFIENKCQEESNLNRIVQEQKQHAEKIRLLKSQIQNAKANSKEKMFIYGEHMPRLLDEIKKSYDRGEFTQLPIGPIGNYIEVPDSKYSNVVETEIGSRLLHAFLVDNIKDSNNLETIIKRLNCPSPTILKRRFMNHVYNVQKGKVSAPVGTILFMDAVKCTHPMVMNYLIDQFQMETILLTDNETIAERLTSIKENIPTNLNKVVVFNNKMSNMLLYYPEPKYRMYTVNIRKAKFIQVTINEHIKHLEVEIHETDKRLCTLEAEKKKSVKQLTEVTAYIKNKRDSLQKHQNEFSDLRLKIIGLENLEYSDCNNEVALLKKEIESNKTALSDIEEKITDLKVKYAEYNKKAQHLKHEQMQKENILQTIQDGIEKLQNEMYLDKTKLRSVNDNYAKYESKLQDIKLEELQLQKIIKETTLNLNKAKLCAERNGERPSEILISEDEIRKKIATTKTQLQRGKPTYLNENDLRELIACKERTRDTSNTIYKCIDITIKKLSSSLHKRYKYLHTLKLHTSSLIVMYFNHVLELRHFVGELVFDHAKQTLNVFITPQNNIPNGVSSTRSLSGGERSFSTIALLISLWSVADHPFCFLDEYDVFTDEMNRDYIKCLLIEEGYRQPKRQYSFLTPQDMTLVKQSFIKIHRLAEPDRD